MAKQKPENKQIALNWQFRGIELVSSSVTNPSVPDLNISAFNFQIEVENRINVEEKLTSVIVKVTVTVNDPPLHLGSITTNNVFEIVNLEEIVIKKDNSITLPTPVSEMLNSIAISTTRGVMFGQFRGTFLHNAILPIIDPKSLQPNLNPLSKQELAANKK